MSPVRRWSEKSRAELATAAAEQRMLLENTHDIVFRHDSQGAFTYVSPAVERITGRTAREWLTNWQSFLTGSPVNAEAARITREMLRSGQESPLYQVEVIHREGRRIRLEVKERPYFEGGKLIGFVGVGRDVTERVRAEEALRESQERERRHAAELVRVARLKLASQIASTWAHEIHQPLTAIVGYAKGCARRLRQGNGDLEEIGAAMDEIAAEAFRASEVVAKLRRFLGRGERKPERVDINALIRSAARLAEPHARSRGVSIRLKLAGDLPPLWADAIGLEAVVINLVQNSIEAMHGNSGQAKEIEIETCAVGGREVAFSVSDTGIGLPVAAPGKLFEPFFSTKPGALGLGLAVSMSIVQAHRGQLRAEPRPGGGAIFSCTLPACAESGDHDGEPKRFHR